MPSPPTGEIKAVADVLADEANADRRAEEIAEAVIHALDEERGKKKRIAIVANYRWRGDEKPQLAVFGPFQTGRRAEARVVGERMAGTMQGGSGKWLTVPCYWSAKDAWDACKERSMADRLRALEALRRAEKAQRDQPGGLLDRWVQRGPDCMCGSGRDVWCHRHLRRCGDARAA